MVNGWKGAGGTAEKEVWEEKKDEAQKGCEVLQAAYGECDIVIPNKKQIFGLQPLARSSESLAIS